MNEKLGVNKSFINGDILPWSIFPITKFCLISDREEINNDIFQKDVFVYFGGEGQRKKKMERISSRLPAQSP